MSVLRVIWRSLAVLILLALIAATIAWAMRKDIARNYADAEIKRRGIPARYQITEIGPSRQRLEKISLGDPANPDLTADWAEVITATGFSGVSVKMVRAGGLRLKGKFADGRTTFGVLDKLVPPPSDKPFTLPDFRVELSDARIRLDTPYGPVGARFDGGGNIATSLKGKLAALMPDAALDPKCKASGLTAYLDVSTASRRISVKGPVRASAANCSGVDIAFPQAQVDLVTDDTFARIDSDVAAETRALRYSGTSLQTARATGRVTYTKGAFKGDGNGSVTGLRPEAGLIAQAVSLVRRADGTPVAPLGDSVVRAILGLNNGSSGQTRFSFDGSAKAGTVLFDGVAAQSASGAIFRFAPESSAEITWPKGRYTIDGGVTLAGGGFPATSIRFDSNKSGLAGVATIAPLSAGRTRLALTPIRFAFANGAASIATTALYDGALGGGQVRGLLLPVSVRGGTLVGDCLNVGLKSYTIANLALAPIKTNVCLRGGQAMTGPMIITARLGGSPLSLALKSARYGTGSGAFAADGIAVRLGDAQRLSQLDIATLNGVYKNGAANGRFLGAAGQIGNVPLLLSEIGGDWAFANQVLTIKGGLRVADAAKAPRYLPLVSNDVALRLADNKITATGALAEPFTKTAISNVTITHDLTRSTGKAILDVPGLTFGQVLQPERLTSITLGVIANVQGALAGRGEINWTENGVSSTGGFRTDNLNFAAAFGPVTGLKGEIALSDLLGLTTPEGQSIIVGSINPGISVVDGKIRYRLLPDLKLEIEGGRWPFAGGELILVPSILDLNQAAERRLTFRVQGLDAALFVQQMAFDNISVTGTFDGLLPMVFDQNGGRIEGGSLTVREGGGTLSYVGDVSNAELGRFSKLAFDALKSIRYKRLTLELNGALDGEMVTVVRFNGVNQLPLAQTKNFFLKQFNEIPFLFNITIKAPFRGLFSMVRSFNDPSIFIPRGLQALPPPPPPPAPVQTKESETVR
jgi:translocation and assembly module TamB